MGIRIWRNGELRQDSSVDVLQAGGHPLKHGFGVNTTAEARVQAVNETSDGK